MREYDYCMNYNGNYYNDKLPHELELNDNNCSYNDTSQNTANE